MFGGYAYDKEEIFLEINNKKKKGDFTSTIEKLDVSVKEENKAWELI